MALERILVGDDRLEFARSNFPSIPNAEVEFVDNPRRVIEKAQAGEYSMVVTDLEYTQGGREGFQVLEALRENKARKILWTGAADNPEVQEKVRELGAELLSKEQIGSLVGQVVNQAPLKRDGKVLIYASNPGSSLYNSIEKVTGLIFEKDQVKVSSNLRQELETYQYGLVIDTSTMLARLQGGKPSLNGVVAHDMKYLKLREVPRVVCLPNPFTALADMAEIGKRYFASIKS